MVKCTFTEYKPIFVLCLYCTQCTVHTSTQYYGRHKIVCPSVGPVRHARIIPRKSETLLNEDFCLKQIVLRIAKQGRRIKFGNGRWGRQVGSALLHESGWKICLHPFQTSTRTPTKLTLPIKLLLSWRKYGNWVIKSIPLQGIFVYPVSLHLFAGAKRRPV